MVERLVTVATFANPVESNLARNRLEAASIQSFLADEEYIDGPKLPPLLCRHS